MNRRQLLRRLTQGALHNVPEALNLQPEDGQAKPYQIRQLLKLVEEHELSLED